jgi:dTDP-4-amino-4,6-dideoxygalactose transaminase
MRDKDNINLLDTGAQWAEIAGEAESAVLEVLRSGRWALGPRVEAFEQEMAAYLGARHAIGVASGSDALILALLALDIGPGDEVITTPSTFIATATAITRIGAVPVFADVREDDLLLDAAAVEKVITNKTRAILPVHLYGQCVDGEAFDALARLHRLPIVEDACQAVGATRGIVRAGAFGELAAFSFYPTKNLSAAGDAGLVTTNDERLDKRVRRLRDHGSDVRYEHIEVGLNSRLDAVQAAILSVKLKRLDGWTQARNRIADAYVRLFGEAGLGTRIRPLARHGGRHVFHQFMVRAERRDELRAHLAEKGIGSEVYYPIPLHLQECFTPLGYREGDFPIAEQAARELVALPVHPDLADADVERVVSAIADFY